MTVREIIQDNSSWKPGRDYDIAQKPEISILLPTYRRNKNGYLRRAVESFMYQTLVNIELIIIDDGSTDGTEYLISQFMKLDGRISCIRHKKNVGLPAVSIFEGFLKARSDYIGFLFDDCVLTQSALELTLLCMHECDWYASYGDTFMHTSESDQEQGRWFFIPEENIGNLEMSNIIGNTTLVCHRKVFDTIGWYDPHVSLIRVCDWDLLLRIKRHFILGYTEIEFAEEYGLIQKDSLGNSKELNSNLLLEHIKYPQREEMLQLNNYLDYDVFFVPEDCSQLYILGMLAEREEFEGKFWFNNKEFVSGLPIFYEQQFMMPQIYVKVPHMSASADLCFKSELHSDLNSLFYYSAQESILTSQAIIFARDLDESPLLLTAEDLGIPRYLYWDDNFTLLTDLYSEVKHLTPEFTRNFFSRFDGVLVSTQTLYNELKIYSKHMYLVEPIYFEHMEGPVRQRRNEDPVRIAFIGGIWRANYLNENIIPALSKLAADREVHLYLPQYKEFKVPSKMWDKTIHVHWIPYSNSMEQMLMLYQREGIHIQIHGGDDSPNNRNKTLNALLAACCIGAALVTSNEEPFNLVKYHEPLFEMADNHPTRWLNTLEKLIQDDAYRTDLIRSSRMYCRERYNGYTNRKIVQTILDRSDPVDFREYQDRIKYAPFIKQSFNPGAFLGFQTTVFSGFPSPRIISEATYSFVCDKQLLQGVDIAFATHNQRASGTLKVIIINKEENIKREIEVEMYRLKDNQKHRIKFAPIKDAHGLTFQITFIFAYDDGVDPISVYEANLLSNNRIKRKILRTMGKRPDILLQCVGK